MVCQNYYPEIGSSASRMQSITHLMKNRGYEIEVVTPDSSYPNVELYQKDWFWNDSKLNHQSFIKRLPPVHLKYKLRNAPRFFMNLLHMIQGVNSVRKLTVKPDVVFASISSFHMAMLGMYAKWKYRVPFILDVSEVWSDSIKKRHGMIRFNWILSPMLLIERQLYKFADEIIISTEGYRSYIRQCGVSDENIHYIPNSICQKELFIKRTISVNGQMEIIYAGNIGVTEDISLLFELAERFRHETRIRYKLIGYGHWRECVKQTIKDRNFENVLFLDVMPRTETFQAIKNADVAFISFSEPEILNTMFPKKLIDYMATGKPIIAAVSGHIANIIETAEAGFVSRKHDVDELERMLRKLLKRPDLREAIGKNGIRYVEDNFLWEININVLDQLVMQLDETYSS